MQNKRRKASSSAQKQRQRIARQLGEAMHKAGGRVGRRPMPVERIPNLENYRQVMHGMGLRLKPVDLRRLRDRGTL